MFQYDERLFIMTSLYYHQDFILENNLYLIIILFIKVVLNNVQI
jgi:hypothetical protein